MKKALKEHQNPDAEHLEMKKLTWTGCKKEKFPGAPHKRTEHKTFIGHKMCTDPGGRYTCEEQMGKSTTPRPWASDHVISFVIQIKRKAHVAQVIKETI